MKKLITIVGLLGLIIVQAQKVGINTDDPKATLDIKSEGNANDTKALKIMNSDNIEIVTVTDDGKVGIITGEQHIKIGTGANTSGYTLDVGLNDDGVNFINNSTDRGFNFGNKAGNLLHLNHNGNVGIGTTSPKAKLDITGSLLVGGKHDGTNIIVFEDISATGTKGNQWELYPDKNSFGLYNRTNQKYALKITNNGNVGIGTANPATKLDVSGQLRIGTLNDAAEADNVKVLVTGADGVVKTKSISSVVNQQSGWRLGHKNYYCNARNKGKTVYFNLGFLVCKTNGKIYTGPGVFTPVPYFWEGNMTAESFYFIRLNTKLTQQPNRVWTGENVLLYHENNSSKLYHYFLFVIDDSQYTP